MHSEPGAARLHGYCSREATTAKSSLVGRAQVEVSCIAQIPEPASIVVIGMVCGGGFRSSLVHDLKRAIL